MKLSKILLLLATLVTIFGFFGCGGFNPPLGTVLAPTLSIGSTNFSRLIEPYTDDGEFTAYDQFTTDLLKFGPVIKGFEIRPLVANNNVMVSMPDTSLAIFTISNDQFTYSNGTDTNITINNTIPITETVEIPFSDGDNDFIILKRSTFAGDITQETFNTTWEGYGFLYDATNSSMMAVARMSGNIVKTNTEYGVIIKTTDHYNGTFPTYPEWDLDDIDWEEDTNFDPNLLDTLPRLYLYDSILETYFLYTKDDATNKWNQLIS